MALAPGTTLGRYRIHSALGAGGMGEVYRAGDLQLGRDVAIKILPPHLSANPEARKRFDREAKIISGLNHPNVCTLFDVGHQDGVDFLVMEYLEGETLQSRLSKGPLPLEQALKYGAQIARGLERAHRKGIVHRDLKPGNIMLTPSGAKLLDFGLARIDLPSATAANLTASMIAPQLTQERTIAGTLPYMSPEQVRGSHLDPRSDIFSLGAVLYEMVTGRSAFPGKGQSSVLRDTRERS